MERQVLSPTSQPMRMTTSWLNGGAAMTELQELMLYTCFGAMTGVFIAEIIVIIVSAVSWVKDKIRKRKEAKKTKESATKVD